MKLGTKTYYTRHLDTLISRKVRAVGYCERCGGKSNLQTAHIISRKNRTLRFDFNNLLCLCSGCHFWAHQDPLGFVDFIDTNYPHRHDYLNMYKNHITKYSAKDLKELYLDLKKEVG